jgi:hypothetical protein
MTQRSAFQSASWYFKHNSTAIRCENLFIAAALLKTTVFYLGTQVLFTSFANYIFTTP